MLFTINTAHKPNIRRPKIKLGSRLFKSVCKKQRGNLIWLKNKAKLGFLHLKKQLHGDKRLVSIRSIRRSRLLRTIREPIYKKQLTDPNRIDLPLKRIKNHRVKYQRRVPEDPKTDLQDQRRLFRQRLHHRVLPFHREVHNHQQPRRLKSHYLFQKRGHLVFQTAVLRPQAGPPPGNAANHQGRRKGRKT